VNSCGSKNGSGNDVSWLTKDMDRLSEVPYHNEYGFMKQKDSRKTLFKGQVQFKEEHAVKTVLNQGFSFDTIKL